MNKLNNDILIIAVVDSMTTWKAREAIANNIKEGLDKGVIIKDKLISNLYVIDKDKKEMITIVY